MLLSQNKPVNKYKFWRCFVLQSSIARCEQYAKRDKTTSRTSLWIQNTYLQI